MHKNSNIVIFMPSIEGGGVEKNLFLITNYLSQKFKKLTLITCSRNIKNFNKKIKIINFTNNLGKINFRLLKIIISSLFLFIYLLKNKNVIVLSFQANIFAILIGFLLGRKVVVRLNSSPSGWLKKDFKRMLFKKIYSLADLIIVNSFEFKNELKNKLNINSFCIYNPLNQNEIIQKSKIKIKNKIYKNKNSIKMINIGRFVDQKDQITFLKALNLIKNKIDFEAILVGSGAYKSKLSNFISKNKLNGKIKLINFAENPYPVIRQTEILILSSKYEGLPNVLLEAQVLKKFIISSNCPTGPREILLNGKAGLLFKVGNFRELANKILYYNKNKKNLIKLVNQGYIKLDRFNYNLNLKKYLELIKKV